MANAPIFAGQRATAALIASLAPQAVLKQLDQSVISSNVLTNDAELQVPVAANAQYIFVCYLDYEGGTTGSSDIKIGWTAPAGAALRYTPVGWFNTSGGVSAGTTFALVSVPSFGTNGAGNLLGIFLAGSLFCGNAGGTLQLRWAQNTSNGVTATIVHAQSLLALWRVS